MIFPNFIIIGANKGGTSSFYQYLSQHPEVFMSEIKEPMFFLFWDKYEQDKKTDHAEPEWLNWKPISSLEVYQRMFVVPPHIKAAGEASTAYLANPRCAERIHDFNPQMKIIAVLRNPVFRAFSNYQMYVRLGYEKEKFEACVEQELSGNRGHLPQGRHYVQLGYYGQALARYYTIFGEENVRVYLNEELRDKPEWLFRDAFNFLGVDATFKPNVTEKFNVNENVTLRNGFQNLLVSADRKIPFTKVLGKTIRSRIYGELHLSPAMQSKLGNLYRDDVRQLERLAHRDLSHWIR